MKRVVIESPFGSRPDGTRCTPEEMASNAAYLDRCIAHSLSLGEAPFASHGFFPRVLNDAKPEERRQGMEAGFAWGEQGELVAVYVDRSVTSGMVVGLNRYRDKGIAWEQRAIFAWCDACDRYPAFLRPVHVLGGPIHCGSCGFRTRTKEQA